MPVFVKYYYRLLSIVLNSFIIIVTHLYLQVSQHINRLTDVVE